jgi:hypothetical protein
MIAGYVARRMANDKQLHGRSLDFAAWHWRPPLAPAAVVASERQHLERRLDCASLVSLTDHDTLEGPKALRRTGDAAVPLSVEWSVPFDGTVFHLGVHAINSGRLSQVEPVLAACTAGSRDDLGDILDWLIESPETFVVLNHPYWDLTQRGPLQHDAVLLRFMRRHRHRIHALELNGYRTWAENRRVLPLADGFGLPIVGGGDRHGRAPNSIVNVTRASCLAEFAADLRAGRPTDCLLFEEYAEPFASRLLQGARDCLARDRQLEVGQVWTDRVFFTSAGGEEIPLNAMWRAPWWLTGTVALTQMLGSDIARGVFSLATPGRNRELNADLSTLRQADSVLVPQIDAA